MCKPILGHDKLRIIHALLTNHKLLLTLLTYEAPPLTAGITDHLTTDYYSIDTSLANPTALNLITSFFGFCVLEFVHAAEG